MRIVHTRLFLVAAALSVSTVAPAQVPLGASFTYQGRLARNNAPEPAPHTFTFTLWDGLTGGTAIGAADTQTVDPDAGGLFTVVLNRTGQFGPQVVQTRLPFQQIPTLVSIAPRPGRCLAA